MRPPERRGGGRARLCRGPRGVTGTVSLSAGDSASLAQPALSLVCASACRDDHTRRLGDFTPNLFQEVASEATPDFHHPK